ncbi:MAG: protein kinase [Muribaculaceae bacterium]|nr:protein kinase [Muribaculaceae bacterium]
MAEDKHSKWTEIEHLPEWDEEFYEVYTAKKHGKWLMLKTLKPELRDKAEFKEMIGKEFDVRYNLAHPHIVMINDFEEVPGLGMCIITDDVYGESLRKLMSEGKADEDILRKVTTQLVEAMDYIQTNHIVHHPITADRIIFTDKIHNLKVIDVGFDQRNHLTATATSDDIYNFGVILSELLSHLPHTADSDRLQKVAQRCMESDRSRRYRDIQDLKMALSGRSNNRLYIIIIAFLSLMILLLAWLNSSWAPDMISDSADSAGDKVEATE